MRSDRLTLDRIGMRSVLAATFAAAAGFAGLSASAAPQATAPGDPLAAEISRWSGYLSTHGAGDEAWEQVKAAGGPAVAAAEKALVEGRRWLAFQRLAAARPLLAATVYSAAHMGPERSDGAAFDAEWARMGRELHAELGAIPPGTLDGVQPAAVRAMAEIALPQIRGYYDASLEYARNTVLDSGLFYLGAAQAHRDFVAFCRTLGLRGEGAAPKLRPLSGELDGLEGKLLAAYRPPASIDRHGEFIAANSAVKDARELDAAGLRYGALARYLQAALGVAPLLPPSSDSPDVAERLRVFEARLSRPGQDHSIGRIFLERAQADLAANPPPARAAGAEAIAADVLPRYFAALAPAAAAAPRPAPGVTVTLVRWPYT